MSPSQLDAIEAALDLKLPEIYRQTSISFPFEPIGNDSVYWFFDDPESVIDSTRSPLDGSEYDRRNWKASFVAIGTSPSGDLYVLETATEALPVLCLSHETHEFDVEWPTFDGFILDWLRAPESAEQVLTEIRDEQRAFWRRWRVVVGIIVLFLLVFGVLPIVIAQWMKP